MDTIAYKPSDKKDNSENFIAVTIVIETVGLQYNLWSQYVPLESIITSDCAGM